MNIVYSLTKKNDPGDASVNKSTEFLVVLILTGWIGSAYATPILQISGGRLTGANEILFMGSNYDAVFSGDSCTVAYSGCDEPGDFIFTTEAVAESFGDKLLELVFVDGPLGKFDTDYTLTGTCALGTSGFCNTYIPYASSGAIAIVAIARNYALEASDQTVGPNAIFRNSGNGGPNVTLAVITLSSHQPEDGTVPTPATLALFGIGLAGLGWSRRKKA